MRAHEARRAIRAAAWAYEAALPSAQRKLLGQFFTGLPLGKLLAHLALAADTRTVLDPMAGHGDLLDASWEAAFERGIALKCLDGIELDEPTSTQCWDRLTRIVGEDGPPRHIVASNAFDSAAFQGLQGDGYDLVITNPPYVRYQTRNGYDPKGDKTRAGLATIATGRLSGADKSVWAALVDGYSGLADLSIPSWLLAGLLVRPGGHLALVVPATWRSRDYADVIRYLMLRCFALDCIVEDTQPGWFSGVLVRTHLIVARRLATDQVAIPLRDRSSFPSAEWVQVTPDAADGRSLVGAAFDEHRPEQALAVWLKSRSEDPHRGIQRRSFDLQQEWAALENRISSRRWCQQLEGPGADLPLFAFGRPSAPISLPDVIRDVLPADVALSSLCKLEEAGIQVGQGLRTGCNRFFYVTACGASDSGMVRIKASPAFGSYEFTVPAGALQPVLRRQSETAFLQKGQIPPGRVLDLRGWVLPEDAEVVADVASAYGATGEAPPQTMPDELAAFVRMAALSPQRMTGNTKRIPDLSAVRTNIRMPRNGSVTPRFWYMLPDFTPRHSAAVFVPRINHGPPWAESNVDPPILIDANFSTFWSTDETWTPFALKAILNSVWCRALMEAHGTPLGGGALKLEASHLRRMPIPKLSERALEALDAAGKELTAEATDIQSEINGIVLGAVLGQECYTGALPELASLMAALADKLRQERRRAAS